MKKQKKGNLFQSGLKALLSVVVAVGLFAGGRWLGVGIANGEITWDSLSLSSFASLPVFSLFFDGDQEQREANALEAMQRNQNDDGEEILDGEAINILMMGIDARNPKENSRSDTMILLSVDAKNNQVAMISIPRDTKIKTEKGVVEKINAVNAIEGPEAACKVVGKLLHIEVDHYVVVNFNSFINIVDTLGGVDLYVDMNMFHADDQNPELEIELFEGQQHLNGQQALQYVRYRGGATADIGRTQRQQKFLKAMADKMFSIGAIKKIPSLWTEIKSSVRTDLTITDIGSLVKVATALKDAEIYSQTVPGKSGWSGGASYWIADESLLATLVSDVRSGKTVDVAGDPQGVGTTRGAQVYSSSSSSTNEESVQENESEVGHEESGGLGDLTEPLPPADQEEDIVPDDFWADELENTNLGSEMESPLGDLEEPLAPAGSV